MTTLRLASQPFQWPRRSGELAQSASSRWSVLSYLANADPVESPRANGNGLATANFLQTERPSTAWSTDTDTLDTFAGVLVG